MIKYLINLFKPSTKVRVEIVEKVVLVEVLSPNAYSRLVKQLESPVITSSDTEHTTAYKLGIQRALTVIQKDFAR